MLGLFVVASNAQRVSENGDSGKIARIICTEPISDSPPLYVLKMKGVEYNLDTIYLKKLNPTWIRRVVVSKGKDYGEPGKNGVIMIFPKRHAIQEISKVIEIEKITAPNTR